MYYLEANIFGSAWGWVTGFVTDQTFAAVASLVVLYVANLARKHLVPYLQTQQNKDKAVWIAQIADDVTDELVARYPNQKAIKLLNEAVDKIIAVTGVGAETAKRAATAAIVRNEHGVPDGDS